LAKVGVFNIIIRKKRARYPNVLKTIYRKYF